MQIQIGTTISSSWSSWPWRRKSLFAALCCVDPVLPTNSHLDASCVSLIAQFLEPNILSGFGILMSVGGHFS